MATPFRRQALSFSTRVTAPVSLFAVGAGLLLVATGLRWFQVPAAASPDTGFAWAVAGREAPASIVFKALCMAALLGFSVVAYRARRSQSPRRLAARGSAALLALLLFFPHAVMIWCPDIAGEANWLHVQHKSLTWLGGDVFGIQELKDVGWKSRVYAADLLDPATVMNAPAWSPRAVPMGSLQDLANWFGYSNPFCQFLRAGWGMALAGCLLVLLAVCRTEKGPDLQLLGASARMAAAVLGAGIALGLAPAALCAWQLDRARAAVERGLPAIALAWIEAATRTVPVVGQSSDLVLERGLLETRLGRETPAASLYRAKVLQGQGMIEQAEALFGSLLPVADEAVRREAVRGLLRRGIRELNSGETARAANSLEAVLGADPCNVKANYVLQLAYLRATRFASLRELAARMRATYRFFSDDTKMPILAAAQENVAYAAYLQDDPGAAHAAWKALGDPKRLSER